MPSMKKTLKLSLLPGLGAIHAALAHHRKTNGIGEDYFGIDRSVVIAVTRAW